MIVGICGFIGSGKDTIADYLVNLHGFHRESFASTLKDAVADIFGWDRELLEGRSRSAREWRDQVDIWWAERLGIPDLTPRWAMQHIGTDIFRTHFHDNIWIASLENKLRKIKDDVVITDCRFPNEIAALRNAGAKIIRVKRGPEPSWYDSAVSLNQGPERNLNWANSKFRLQKLGIHSSETAWVGTEFDAVLDNDGTMEELFCRINDLVLGPQDAMVSLAA